MAELAAYAARKYNITEQPDRYGDPRFSVLCHPRTGKYVALLMKYWDSDLGVDFERCDLRCGSDAPERSYILPPLRMRGSEWRSIAFDGRTERELVFGLFDKAIREGDSHGFKIVLASQLPPKESGYRDTALPFERSSYQPPKEKLPEKLREMKRLYEYGRETVEARARNFYRQAVFMEDFEDDFPWKGEFSCYFPTYHDMTTDQLRGYFTWRTQLRKGNFQPIPTSAAFIYIYELLNGVGADSPEDVLRKLEEFEAGFIDSGLGDKRMRSYVRGWKTEYAAVNGLSPELVKRAADPEMLKRDAMLAALRDPFAHSDEEVFRALCVLGGGKTADSPVIALDPERGMRLFSDTWRGAARSYRRDKGLFELCFGGLMSRPWNPLSNAVYYQRSRPKDADYILSDCRLLICRGGVWRQAAFESSLFDRSLLQGFLHETDARLRRYLKTGRYLRERPADSWVTEFVDAVIGADKIIMLEKSRPKINIDLSGLDKIRRDAAVTRDSLLTEEELEEPDTAPEPEPPAADLPLDGVQIRILRALLRGEDVSDILGENHLMPSVTADSINEGLFDEFGDSVIICEDDRLSLVEDYIEDIEQMLGGKENG